jgi:hypothetical protein
MVQSSLVGVHRAAERRLTVTKHALAGRRAAVLGQFLLGAAPHNERAKTDVRLVELLGRQARIAEAARRSRTDIPD